MIAPGGHRSGSAVRIAATVQALAVDHAVTVALVIGNDPPGPGVVDRCAAWCAEHGVGMDVISAPPKPRNASWRAVRLWVRSVSTGPFGGRRRIPARFAAQVASADVLWVFHIYPFMVGAVPTHRCTVVDIDDLKERLDPAGPHLFAVGRRLHRDAVGRLRRRVLDSAQVVTVSSPNELDHIARMSPRADLALLANTAVDPRTSDRDLNHQAGTAPGVATGTAPRVAPGTAPRVVMVGNLSYRPNAEAASWFVDQVWPRVRAAVPSATFALVGAGADVALTSVGEGDGVELLGEVADLSHELSQASVSVAPVLSGTGTRVKIIEAFAWGLPVVSTTAGASGLNVVDARDLLVADAPASFASAVIRLLTDRELAGRLGANGRAVFEEHHHQTVFDEQVRELSGRAMTAGAAMDITQVVLTGRFAGIERYVTTLAGAMASEGHWMRIVCPDPAVMAAGSATTAQQSAVEFVAATNWRRAAWVVARTRHTDIVHVHTTGSLVGAAVGLVGRSTPLVVTRHFAWRRWSDDDGQGRRIARLRDARPSRRSSSRRRPQWLRAAAQRWVDRQVDGEVAVSQVVADGIGHGAAVIHPGVEQPAYRVPATQRRQSVLVLQRLEPDKATDVALRAWAASSLRHQHWILDVVGDGSQSNDLAAMIDRLAIADSVVMHGHADDVGPLLQRAALLMAPAPAEPFGLSVVEAMAAGVPVVAAASGGHLETLGRVDGAALFMPGDADGAAALLDRLGPDADARQDLADAQLAVQQQCFDLTRQVATMERFYRRMVGPQAHGESVR